MTDRFSGEPHGPCLVVTSWAPNIPGTPHVPLSTKHLMEPWPTSRIPGPRVHRPLQAENTLPSPVSGGSAPAAFPNDLWKNRAEMWHGDVRPSPSTRSSSTPVATSIDTPALLAHRYRTVA